MKTWLCALAVAGVAMQSPSAHANTSTPVSVEIVGADGRVFQEFPVSSPDGALRSYLEAEKGARYQLRVRNQSGERLGLVIAVDGRNIINGRQSQLARGEPMYVIDAWSSEAYAGWRASLQEVNEFHFTDWHDSYAEAFGDRSARGVIAVAVFREVAPPPPAISQYPPSGKRPAADAASAGREASAGTGYGERRQEQAVRVEFRARNQPESRHFIKYEWRDTLCRKRVLDCAEQNRFWDESTLGFAPPPPGRR